MKFLIHWFISAFALLVAAELVPGVTVSSLYVALIAAVVLGLLNILVKPVLFILTLPINILTLGLFSFVLNASLFFFAASFIEGFAVSSFWYALLGSIVVSIVNTVASKFVS